MSVSSQRQFYLNAGDFIGELLHDMSSAATFLSDHRYDARLSNSNLSSWVISVADRATD